MGYVRPRKEGEDMLGILSASLALTLLLETTAAALWGLRRQNLLLGVMVNLLTNPAAVLLHQLFPGWGVTLVLEGAVVMIEGAYYAKYGLRIRHPWLLSLSANALSVGVGVVINRLL